MKKVSIIVPCYNEAETIPLFFAEISNLQLMVMAYKLEIIFVNDGSTDLSLNIIKKIAKEAQNVKYISFSRNFGKEAAIYAGLQYSQGEYVAVMDVDLQDPPSLLPEMLQLIKDEGYDSVGTRRVTRKGEPPIRSFFARIFYKLINKISKTEIVDGARDYRLMTRKFVDSLLQLKEYNRFSKGLFNWVGYKTKWIEFENIERVAGETKWSFWKLLIYSLEGIIAFSTIPLMISVIIGLMFCFISFFMMVLITVRTLMFGDSVAGWPSMICLILFIGGIQLFCIGILGSYLAKTYMEVKKRPVYICEETNIASDKEDGE